MAAVVLYWKSHLNGVKPPSITMLENDFCKLLKYFKHVKRSMSLPIVVFPISIPHYRVISFRETPTLKTMTALTNPKFETMCSSILSSSMVAYTSVLAVKISIYGIFEPRHVISNNLAFRQV